MAIPPATHRLSGLLLLGLFLVLGCTRTRATMAHYKPVQYWVEALQSPDTVLRKQAVRVLGNVGTADPAVVPALTSALKDRQAEVRRQAILALLKLGPAARPALPALRDAVQDKDQQVRSYGRRAIEVIDTK